MIQEEIAKTFLKLVCDYVGKEEYAEICRRNLTIEEGCCATHDFCDANVFMHAAMHLHGMACSVDMADSHVGILTPEEIDAAQERANTLWSDAWGIALNLTQQEAKEH